MLLESGPMPQTAEEIAVRIAAMLATPFQLGDTEVTISVSIGISVALQSQSTCEELLREADLAMYMAKQNGKGRFEIIRPGMQDDAFKHLALITDLRHALVNNEFEVFYQPIVGVRDAMPAGAEALVRWHHPQRGLVSPAEFVGAAESTGLIVAIGGWVLNEACRQAQAWRQAQTIDDAFYVSVNLSLKTYRALIFVNGWNLGQYINDVGPQHTFVLPNGILDPNGTNTLAIAVIAVIAN